jgi:peptide/nickel transport system permease protein
VIARLAPLARKLGAAFATVGFVLVLNFFLFRVLPGDPARAGVQDPRMSEESIAAVRARFGLDQPVVNGVESLHPLRFGSFWVNPLDTQFARYFTNLARGELGISYHSNRPVAELLRERLGNTLLLLAAGQFLALAVGVALGAFAAARGGGRADRWTLLAGLSAWSLPSFWLAMVLLFFGAGIFGLPLGGRATPGLIGGPLVHALDVARHLVLPTLTFTIVYFGEYLLVTRSALLDALGEDYVLVARAKGLSRGQVLRRHALRGAALPIVTLVALNLGLVVAGAVQVEMVFSWPGLGLAMYEAVVRRDYPVLQGVFLLLAVSVVLANLLVELVYPRLDPRTRGR